MLSRLLVGILLVAANASAAAAAATTCSTAVRDWLGETSSAQMKKIENCVNVHRYCALSEQGRVFFGTTIDDLPAKQKVVWRIIVAQLDRSGTSICLVGAAGPGSSGLWDFAGWSFSSGAVQNIEGVESLDFGFGAVDLRSLARDIVNAYDTVVSVPAQGVIKPGYWVLFAFSSKVGGAHRHHELYQELKREPALSQAELHCVFNLRQPDMKTKVVKTCKGSSGVLVGPYPNPLAASKVMELRDKRTIMMFLFKCTGRCIEAAVSWP